MTNNQITGSYRDFSDKPQIHFAADDFEVNAPAVEYLIIGYLKEKVTAPNGREAMKLCLQFDGEKKRFPINATNGKLITRFLGTNRVENWVGCKIYLYRTTVKAFKDPAMPCIRVAI